MKPLSGAGASDEYVHTNPPYRVRFGAGAVERLAASLAACGGTRAMLLCGPAVLASPAQLVERAVAGSGGRINEVFSGVEPHVPMAVIDEARARFTDGGCDALVALGGSSSIDSMRAVAVTLATGRTVGELFASSGRRVFAYQGPRPEAAMIAVPTTFSSSEVTFGGAVTSPAGEKYVCAGPALFVDEIVLDPDAFASTPRDVLVTTGLCALNHALERSVSEGYQELAGAQLRTSTALLFANLPHLAHGPIEDGEALRACIVGAHLSTSMEIMSGRTHALAHVLGGRYRASHGALHGIFVPFVGYGKEIREDEVRLHRLRTFCEPLAQGQDVQGSRILGADDLRRLLGEFVGSLGAPTSLRELGIPQADLPEIAELAADDISAGSAERATTLDAFASLLDAAW
jgi:alcohol dehydrogenase class IV